MPGGQVDTVRPERTQQASASTHPTERDRRAHRPCPWTGSALTEPDGQTAVRTRATWRSHVHPLDPARRRIRRLGQTKPVHVTKYVYANTFEKNIVKLHQQIAEGKIQFTNSGVPREGVALLLKDVI